MPRSLRDLNMFIKKINNKVQDLEYVSLKTIGSELVRQIKRNFDDEGLHSNNGFAPWKPSKASLNRIKKGRVSDTTLLDTYKLYKSIKYEINEEERNVKVGLNLSDVPYAKSHNEGDSNNIRRQFLYINNEAKENVKNYLDKYLSVSE